MNEKKSTHLMTDEEYFAYIREKFGGVKTIRQIIAMLLKDIEAAREAAYLFHEQNVTIRTALAECLNHNSSEFVIYDHIIEMANSVFAFRRKHMCSCDNEAIHMDNCVKIIKAAVADTMKKRGSKAKKGGRK